jgi:hypothetical protein
MRRSKNPRQGLVREGRVTRSMTSHKRPWCFPNELLCQIFVRCLPETDCPRLELNLAPILLTRICRRWKEVAVGIPTLWCRLSVEVRDRPWQPHAAFCYDTWLKRSRGRPLSLALICSGDDIPNIRRLLQPYMNRIFSLSLDIEPRRRGTDLLWQDLPALRELDIRMYLTNDNLLHWPFNLRSLKLSDSRWSQECYALVNPLVWAHLTDVQIIVCDTVYACIPLLRSAPNLSSLEITFYFELGLIWDIPTGSEPLTHRNLRTLFVDIDFRKIFLFAGAPQTDPLLGLFKILTLPNLRQLQIRRVVVGWPHEEFKAFLARSNCPLDSVTFGAGVTTTEQRAEYFLLIPGVVVES